MKLRNTNKTLLIIKNMQGVAQHYPNSYKLTELNLLKDLIPYY